MKVNLTKLLNSKFHVLKAEDIFGTDYKGFNRVSDIEARCNQAVRKYATV